MCAVNSNEELLPCHICGRTFLPSPLKTHIRVCERNATRKRKIFNSLKQRVEGTDLADFHKSTYLRKSETQAYQPVLNTGNDLKRNSQNKWKEKHEEFVQAIRAAKGAPEMGPRRSISAVGTMGVTERCPSCDRQFGPKAFDRHVEWCKERQTRMPKSPANVSVAKERLEARTKYRVPPMTKSKRSITREKYSPSPMSRTDSLVSVRSSTSVERSPSIRKPKQAVMANHQYENRMSEPVVRNKSPLAANKSLDADYDPFVTAEKQLMELLQCDDFKPFTKSPKTVQLSPRNSNTSKSKTSVNINKNIVSAKSNSSKNSKTNSAVKRASVIDPPNDFQDQIFQDNFEVIENYINDNYSDKSIKNSQNTRGKNNKNNKDTLSLNSILSERKYSDDLTSIDPHLINENDNLAIPDNLTIENDSPNEVDHYSIQYDRKISSIEPLVLPKTEVIKRSMSVSCKGTIDDIEFDEFMSSFDDDESFPTLKSFIHTTKSEIPDKKSINRKNSTVSLNSSFGKISPSKSPENKKSSVAMKRSVSLSNPIVKARSMKNKQDIQDYLHVKDTKPSKREHESPDAYSPKSTVELFSADHEMYEEYKKYEEMYLREQMEKNEEKNLRHNESDEGSSGNEEILVENKGLAMKFSGDSAYGSLNRNSSKVNQRVSRNPQVSQFQVHKDVKATPHSSSSSGSETSPIFSCKTQIDKRMSKFCHECGSRFPVSTAKFCVECGIKRLVL